MQHGTVNKTINTKNTRIHGSTTKKNQIKCKLLRWNAKINTTKLGKF